MKLTVNGEEKQVAADLTVSGLLAHLGLDKQPVAVELNRQVVPRKDHATTTLAQDDVVELVTFVGGG